MVPNRKEPDPDLQKEECSRQELQVLSAEKG